jgi:hypothetical protein
MYSNWKLIYYIQNISFEMALKLKGTVQRDLFGWKWYNLIDPP